MFNLPTKKLVIGVAVIVALEVFFLHFFFNKTTQTSKKVQAYRLLSAKDLKEKGPDLFEKILPQFSDNVTKSLPNNGAQNMNYSSSILPVFEDPEMFVLILVASIPENFDRRHLIRTTWANTWKKSKKNGKAPRSLYTRREYPKLLTNCIFMVGVSIDEKYNRRLTQEASVVGDIFRAETEESFVNMVDKVWKAYAWALSVNTKYIFKVEDGVYINVPRMIHWLNTDKKLPEETYAGYVVYRHPIDGEFDGKDEDFTDPNATKPARLVLPNYCIGAFYIFSANILQGLIDATGQISRIQAGEDAYMGLIAMHSYVLPYNVGNSLFLLDGSHGAIAIEYTEEKLKHSVCIGDKLKSDYISQLHDRYVYIRKRIDGKA